MSKRFIQLLSLKLDDFMTTDNKDDQPEIKIIAALLSTVLSVLDLLH